MKNAIDTEVTELEWERRGRDSDTRDKWVLEKREAEAGEKEFSLSKEEEVKRESEEK